MITNVSTLAAPAGARHTFYYMKVFAVHRVDPTNVGDIASGPTLWVPELQGADHIDVRDGNFSRVAETWREEPVLVVVGGGGLLGHKSFHDGLDAIDALRGPNFEVVVWGVGWNLHYDKGGPPAPEPELLRGAALVGLRDRGTRWGYVPCASVLHPAFGVTVEPTHEVVVFAHKDDKVLATTARAAGLPVMTNQGPDVGAAITFIRSGATVILGSYHGAYWGLLAGRRVAVCEAFSTKFDGGIWGIPVSRDVDLVAAAREAVARPEFYTESLTLNQTFGRTVVGLMESMST